MSPAGMSDTPDQAGAPDAHEALVQFLYRAPIGLVEARIDGSIEMINPVAAQILLPLSDGAMLDNLFGLLDRPLPALRARVAAFASDEGMVCEALRFTDRPPGRQARVLSINLLKLDAGRLMATLSDVTAEVRRDRQGLDRRLRDAARTDTLTRMPNRAALRDLIAGMMERPGGQAGLAILFVNCDGFRRINDALGNAAGDEVLAMMADRLRAVLRQRDLVGHLPEGSSVAARVGGDEFVVILDELPRPDDVHAVAQRLLDVLAQPYGIGDGQVHCPASMGVLLGAQADGDADAVLRDASLAMMQAKRAGGARYVVFEPVMREQAARRSGIEADLRQALRRGELFVVYQPVVALAPEGIVHNAGVEALARWNHPSRGPVPPIEFVAVAEECGLIGALGDFVLDAACRQFVAWHRRLGDAAPRRLAVNLSRAQLGQPDWAATVARILRDTGMDPARLQLEVTESLAAQDAAVQARLHELKALGLTLALDDFGTGYSSLSSLHLLPVDTVKIDRSFVAEAGANRHHRVLIEAMVRVAGSLGMDTVAEGVETAEQAGMLRALGCDKAQGYLFGRPLPAEALPDWLDAHGPPGDAPRNG